eukprot:748626-Hanusia_phi.AAC.2
MPCCAGCAFYVTMPPRLRRTDSAAAAGLYHCQVANAMPGPVGGGRTRAGSPVAGYTGVHGMAAVVNLENVADGWKKEEEKQRATVEGKFGRRKFVRILPSTSMDRILDDGERQADSLNC